jgi:hypothetical protein
MPPDAPNTAALRGQTVSPIEFVIPVQAHRCPLGSGTAYG